MFRPLQADIIQSVLDGKDTLALLPTGGGKSVCYQVPGMMMEGTCLVISPLIALMKDQIEGLRKKGITALSIYSGMNRKEVINTLRVVTESDCKFLYVSPERLETRLFKEYLPGMHINLVAVDEAHCISQWGYDFRPPYLRIAGLRDELPGVPVLALTASATPEVQQDIMDRLDVVVRKETYSSSNKPVVQPKGNWNQFRQSFERANLSYSVFSVDSRIQKIKEILRSVPGSGIVYCKSRKRTQELSELIRMEGISADYYHAGLSGDERGRKQEEWIAGKIRIIVCTNAFGMGIDKPDVRVVIHADMPENLENYYQEAGRGGRDGRKSYAVLLYNELDPAELEASVEIRFPSIETVRQVYQSACNYLQVPAGLGAYQYYDFDMGAFTNRFKLDPRTALCALKILEQEGWLAFNEQVFLPSLVQFTITKDYLYRYEDDHPMHEPVIKTLLRAYGGIFDYPVFISELLVAQLMRKDVEEVKQSLQELDRAGVIDYHAKKDTPQLQFLRDRIRMEELRINVAAIEERKQRFISRMKTMIGFATETVECRSRIIGLYFGDDKIKDCGVCDNCLRRKASALSGAEFEKIREQILVSVGQSPMAVKPLVERISGFSKEKILQVIHLLQDEDELQTDSDGNLGRSEK